MSGKTIAEILEEFAQKHPAAAPILYFVVAFTLIVVLIWFLLFSGLNTSADFVYNQF